MSWVGGASAASATNGGKVYAFNNISEAALTIVAPKSPERKVLTFHNPGVKDLFVAPVVHQTNGLDQALAPSNAQLGGSFRVPASASLTFTGECAGQWRAFSVTGAGSSNPLTVMDSNV